METGCNNGWDRLSPATCAVLEERKRIQVFSELGYAISGLVPWNSVENP
jgi:hypothetical protein